MPSRWWTVTPDDGFDHEGPVDVLAETAERAAIAWAGDRGHDADDHPIVTVTASGEAPRVFELRSRVLWSAVPR